MTARLRLLVGFTVIALVAALLALVWLTYEADTRREVERVSAPR
jgi:hypothetical protein